MNICFFGSYDKEYTRNRILIDGLRSKGVFIYRCESKSGSFFQRYPKLLITYLQIQEPIDIIFMPFFSHYDVLLGWILAKFFRASLMVDAFMSIYETYVFDRRSTKKNSLKAIWYYFIDWLMLTLADKIITDTKAHAQYFIDTFRISNRKIHIVPVGGDETSFFPNRKKQKNKIIIEFHGSFTRLSGAEYFVHVAKMLEGIKNIEFWLIGSSKIYSYPLDVCNVLKPKTLRLFGYLPLSKLSYKVSQAHISVGHLGCTKKASSVVSNKTYQALASGNAVIVTDTPANREILIPGENAYFVPKANPEVLAEAIKILVSNSMLRHKIAQKGYRLHVQKFRNSLIAENFLKVASLLLSAQNK